MNNATANASSLVRIMRTTEKVFLFNALCRKYQIKRDYLTACQDCLQEVIQMKIDRSK